MKTYRLDDLGRHPSAMGRRCEVVFETRSFDGTFPLVTWRGTLAAIIPKPRTGPGYVVALRVRGQLRHTPALPGDTVITIYPKEGP